MAKPTRPIFYGGQVRGRWKYKKMSSLNIFGNHCRQKNPRNFWFLDVEEIATLNETFLNNKFGEKMLNIYYIVVSCKE